MHKAQKLIFRCPDGFANQFRLTLAANILIKYGLLTQAKQEWVINNHNVVDLERFFNIPSRVCIGKLSQDEIADSIKTRSFTYLMSAFNLGNHPQMMRESITDFPLRSEYDQLFKAFEHDNNLGTSLGIHIRTGCKTKLLEEEANRSKPISHESVANIIGSWNGPVFLATDNAETQRKFLNLFPEKIIVFSHIQSGVECFPFSSYDPDKVRRYTTDIHVIADFFLLQTVKLFLGSNDSSFSLIIKWLRNNPADFPCEGKL